MSDGIRANYAKTGFVFAIGVAAIAGALMYIGGAGLGRDEFLVETYYDHPVSGLAQGSDVNFRGVKVGEVRKIGFVGARYADAHGDDCQKIRIIMAIRTKDLSLRPGGTAEEAVLQLINEGLRATVVSSGITGLSKVELNFPRTPVEPEPITWIPENPYIPPSLSMFESLSLSAAKMLHQFNKTDFGSVWSNVSVVAESAAGLVSGMHEFVEGERTRMERLIDDVGRAVDELGALVRDLRENPSSLIRGTAHEPLPETKR